MRFVRKRMTPPNLSLVSWTGITGGAKTGVDTAASARRILGHAVDVYEVWQGLLPFLRRFTMLWSSALSQRVQGRTCEIAP